MIYGYIDEFGTNSLNTQTEGVSSHFILGCTLIKAANLDEAKAQINSIRQLRFQGSEIKSSKVKQNRHARRILILNEISDIKFSLFLLVVDKNKINSEGLTFKQSFYKYFHKILVTYLNSIHGKITFFADNIGSKEYRESFEEYIKKNIIQFDLFNQETKYSFADSADEDLIQLSDFVTGSLAKYFDAKSAIAGGSEYLEILADKLHVRYWPDRVDDYLVFDKPVEEYDNRIAQLSITLAQNRLAQISNNVDTYSMAQIVVLSHLLLAQKVSPKHFVQTHVLKQKIKLDLNLDLQDRIFRKEVIGSLRDNDVIIASSNSGGYKLPVNKGDLIEFVNRYNSIIQPMLGRLKKSRNSILLSTNNEFDILGYKEYDALKGFLEA